MRRSGVRLPLPAPFHQRPTRSSCCSRSVSAIRSRASGCAPYVAERRDPRTQRARLQIDWARPVRQHHPLNPRLRPTAASLLHRCDRREASVDPVAEEAIVAPRNRLTTVKRHIDVHRIVCDGRVRCIAAIVRQFLPPGAERDGSIERLARSIRAELVGKCLYIRRAPLQRTTATTGEPGVGSSSRPKIARPARPTLSAPGIERRAEWPARHA